jgi:hypothetical protein
MKVPRMTTRRWMLAVALASIFTSSALTWHRRIHYRQMAALHAQMQRKSTALARSLTRPAPLTPEAALAEAVKSDLAMIQRQRDNPRSLMAVEGGVATIPAGFLRPGRLQDLRRQFEQLKAELGQLEESQENQRKRAEAQAVYHEALRKKYEMAADQPLSPVMPDPPPP